MSAQTLLSVVRYANLALFVGLGVASWHIWSVRRSAAAAWSAASFGLLGLVVAVGAVVPDDADGFGWTLVVKLEVAALLLVPYFLYRFTRAFERPGRALDRFAFVFTLALLVWTFALPRFPNAGEHRSTAFLAYVVAFLAHWTTFSALAAYRLWRAGRGQPSVARRRMRLLALGSIGLTIALIVSGAGAGSDRAQLVIQLIAFAAALLFFVGLQPPSLVRMLWRTPEQDRLREAVTGLMRAASREEVAANMLPHVAGIVGARASALIDREGTVVGSYRRDGVAADEEPATRMPFESGELLLWTSPLTPFFGREEIEMLRSTTVLLALALERAETLERERRATERLRELNELKDTFLSAVSHELRTPLTAILGFAMTLEQRFDELGPDRALGLVRELVTSAERLERMLADLLDLDRLHRGVLEPRLEEVDVAALAQRTVDGMTLDRRPIVEAEPAVAAVDVAKVERIIENLVYNAFKHTPPGTRVWLSVKALDDGVQLTVADEGPGVPEELRQRIFEPFERGDLAHAPGSGIGLSLVTRFAALHRGRSWVEERVGGGAAFHVFLPQNSSAVTAHRRLLPAR